MKKILLLVCLMTAAVIVSADAQNRKKITRISSMPQRVAMAEDVNTDFSFDNLTDVDITFYPSDSDIENDQYVYAVFLSPAEVYPYLYLTFITNAEGEFEGTYTVADNNLNIEGANSLIVLYDSSEEESEDDWSEDEEYSLENDPSVIMLKDAEMTIVKNEDMTYTVSGFVLDVNDVRRDFSVTAIPALSNYDYPAEPMTPQEDVVLEMTSYSFDNGYEGVYYLTLTNPETGDYCELLYNLPTDAEIADEMPEGTYTIEESMASTFESGYFYYYFPDGCYLITNESSTYFYILSGTITVAYNEYGPVVTLDGVSAGGTHIIVSYTASENSYNALPEVSMQSKAKKIWYDGQLYILRNNKMYNLQGSVVK